LDQALTDHAVKLHQYQLLVYTVKYLFLIGVLAGSYSPDIKKAMIQPHQKIQAEPAGVRNSKTGDQQDEVSYYQENQQVRFVVATLLKIECP